MSDSRQRRADSGPIGQEVQFRISKTPTGHKVTKRDGTGLADGIFTQPIQRYFSGEDSEQKAERYAEKKAAELDADTRVIYLGERP